MHTRYLYVMTIYASINEDIQIEASEEFYGDLQESMCEVPKQDMLAGDHGRV